MRLRPFAFLVAPALLALATARCGSDDLAPAAERDAGGGADGSSSGSGGDGGDDAGPGGPRVEVKNGSLLVDGTPTFLFGGDVQYFRVRDERFDAAKTQAMWEDTLARMQAARMNLLTTYFPWDYHQSGPGQWDFSGPRDVKKFLEIACSHGVKIVAKPGPLITAEWPRGFGTFGAVPEWWKLDHPGSLVRKADGSVFTFSPTGDSSQSQPTFLDPDFQIAIGEWYDKIVPILLPFVEKRCVVAIQVDNETNLYWANRFGDVDYHPVALGRYRAFLTARYGTIAALNAAYGTTFASFDAVAPPSKTPGSEAENVRARDWYDAGQAYVLEYLKKVRAMLETRGLHEPEVMFFTNDSPFGIPFRDVLVHDGTVKNQIGLAGLDLYPKQLPTNGDLADQPFQVDYFTKLYADTGRIYTKDAGGRFAFGAELQGGFYSILGVSPDIKPQATDQLLAKAIGHGLKGGSFYVLRGGLNVDGSSYDFQAAIGPDGAARPRWDVLSRWSRMLAERGLELEAAEEVEDPVTIVQDGAYAVPQAGTLDDHQSLYTNEYPGLFGWLATAGYDAKVVEARAATALDPKDVVFFMIPEIVDPRTARKVVDHAKAGGKTVLVLDKGQRDLAGKPSADVDALAALVPFDAAGSYSWLGVGLRSGTANSKVAGATGEIRTYWYERFFTAKPGAVVEPLVLERTQPLGGDGKIVAGRDKTSGATLLGANFSAAWNRSDYYGLSDGDLGAHRALARAVLEKLGVTPAVRASGLRHLAWARRNAKAQVTYVFVENDGDAGTVHVEVKDPNRLGLAGGARFTLADVLGGKAIGERTGAELFASGFDVTLPKWAVAVIRIASAP